jgi:hypothetical protein
MIMDPGIDGMETYRRILEIHPRQKAILASGFSETDRVHKTLKWRRGIRPEALHPREDRPGSPDGTDRKMGDTT